MLAVQRVALGGEIISKITVIKPDGTRIVRERWAPPNFKAAAWWLERKYPDVWGRASRRIDHRTERPGESQLIWIHDRIRREMEAQDHALCE